MSPLPAEAARLVAAVVLAAGLLTACAHGPVGEVSPTAFSLPTVDGPPLAFGQLRGKVVVVTFFATWCFPCVAEVALLKHLQARHPQDLAIVSIGMDLDGGRVLKPFRDAMQISYPVLVADAATRGGSSPFGPILELPSTFVLDQQGVIRSAFAGVAPEESLSRLIDELEK